MRTLVKVIEILRQLDLGNSVAESDANLQSYFLETQPYRDLITERKDVVAGDKGTGKTALFQILTKNYTRYPDLNIVEVIAAFNPTGSPVFKALADKPVMSEFEYGKLWKAYILATVGNWLLDIYGADHSKHTKLLDDTLQGLSLRTADTQARTIFRIVLDKIGGLFRWKKAEVEFSLDAEGKYAITPRLEGAGEPTKDKTEPELPVETALGVLNQCLKDVDNVVWVALDRLDEAFQGLPDVEIPALRALLRTYLDLKEFDSIKVKLFLRRDLFRRIIETPFVNLTHINSSKVEIFWNDDDLKSLLLRRAMQNQPMLDLLNVKDLTEEALFNTLFPEKVDVGKRQPKTWVWIMRRVRDGNNVKPPRNLIDLVSLARDEQIKREDRLPRDWEPGVPLIESEALRAALAQLSENRVQDTLFAEAGTYSKWIKLFEGARAEHNEASLKLLLGLDGHELRSVIKPLVELGFLEFIRATGTYKIPTLYRAGLAVTQGKAFTGGADADAEDEDDDES